MPSTLITSKTPEGISTPLEIVCDPFSRDTPEAQIYDTLRGRGFVIPPRAEELFPWHLSKEERRSMVEMVARSLGFTGAQFEYRPDSLDFVVRLT
jgi:hypothetical protein